MLYNISNHPTTKWSKEQLLDAQYRWGSVVDVSFPDVAPTATEEDIAAKADEITRRLQSPSPESAVMVQGEFTLTFALVSKLKALGHSVVAATSARNTIENPDGSKTVIFKFVKFRNY